MRADVLQQAPLGDDVANIRDVVESDRPGRENRRRHARQSRVLRAADRDATLDGVATANAKFFHGGKIKGKVKEGRVIASG